ncbi:MAG: hypothetical protein R2750_09330 [Bacteroidales bacterium]
MTGGYYKNLTIHDSIPIHMLNRKGIIFLQDFIAPFYVFMQTTYHLEFLKIKDFLSDSGVTFKSSAMVKRFNRKTKELNFEFEIESNRIKRFVVMDGNASIEAEEQPTEV